MLDWAHSHGIMKQKSFNLIWHISNAVAKGHVASLTWFYTHQYPMSITPTMLQEASRNGHVQVLDWLARTLPVPFPWMGAGVVESACASGHTHVLDWWIAAARDPTLPPGRVPLEYWALALDRATTIQVLDWWLFGNHGLPLKYTSDCVSLISHWKNGATDAMDLWAASGHPMLYGHQYMEKIAMKSQVQLLEWLRANGYALKVRREWYDRLYLQLRLLNGEVVVEDGKELVWNQRWNEFSEAVLRWWEEHIFREGGNDQLEILEPFAPSPLLIRSIPSQPTPPLPRTFLSRLGDLFKF
ncbi:hypothetical protein BC828DRAFT_377250 [Blastocladiella britannica]|nr:hypothetical protein BC828DRAFT_377250 [Blastocladiella britannica]